MSHCITESADGVWAPGAVLQELAPHPRLETGDPGQGNTGNEEWWQECRLQGVFSNTDSFYIFSLIHTINIESAVPAPYPNIVSSSQLDWSQVCSAEACSGCIMMPARSTAALQHCSCMQRPERGHAAPQLAPTSIKPG